MANGVGMHEIVTKLMREEGGVEDVGDGKGETRWGQTKGWCEKWGLEWPESEVQAKENYLLWLVKSGLFHLCIIPDILATAVVDWAIHSGSRWAIKSLQTHLGVGVDGVYGRFTSRAVDNAPDRRRLAAEVVADRLSFLGEITKKNPANTRFIHGWLKRIGRQVVELGL